MKHYGQPTPPPYDFTHLLHIVPTAILTGLQDYVCPFADIEELVQEYESTGLRVELLKAYAGDHGMPVHPSSLELLDDFVSLLDKFNVNQ